MKRETSQSLAVSQEEKLAIEVVANAERLKPATFARAIFYRGLSAYLQDRRVHAERQEEDIYGELERLINSDPALIRLRELIQTKKDAGEALKHRPIEAVGGVRVELINPEHLVTEIVKEPIASQREIKRSRPRRRKQ